MHGVTTLPTLPYSQGHIPTTTLHTPLNSQEPEPPPDDDPLSHLYYREDDSSHVEGDKYVLVHGGLTTLVACKEPQGITLG